jgi:hypothetical protein
LHFHPTRKIFTILVPPSSEKKINESDEIHNNLIVHKNKNLFHQQPKEGRGNFYPLIKNLTISIYLNRKQTKE